MQMSINMILNDLNDNLKINNNIWIIRNNNKI